MEKLSMDNAGDRRTIRRIYSLALTTNEQLLEKFRQSQNDEEFTFRMLDDEHNLHERLENCPVEGHETAIDAELNNELFYTYLDAINAADYYNPRGNAADYCNGTEEDVETAATELLKVMKQCEKCCPAIAQQ